MFYLQHDIDIFSHSEKKKITGISKLITRLHKKKSWMYAFHLTTAGINMHKMMSVLFQTNFCSKNNLTGKNQTFAKKRQASSLTTAALNNMKSNLGENVPGEQKKKF